MRMILETGACRKQATSIKAKNERPITQKELFGRHATLSMVPDVEDPPDDSSRGRDSVCAEHRVAARAVDRIGRAIHERRMGKQGHALRAVRPLLPKCRLPAKGVWATFVLSWIGSAAPWLTWRS
jgi:hypothetical protein